MIISRIGFGRIMVYQDQFFPVSLATRIVVENQTWRFAWKSPAKMETPQENRWNIWINHRKIYGTSTAGNIWISWNSYMKFFSFGWENHRTAAGGFSIKSWWPEGISTSDPSFGRAQPVYLQKSITCTAISCKLVAKFPPAISACLCSPIQVFAVLYITSIAEFWPYLNIMIYTYMTIDHHRFYFSHTVPILVLEWPSCSQ